MDEDKKKGLQDKFGDIAFSITPSYPGAEELTMLRFGSGAKPVVVASDRVESSTLEELIGYIQGWQSDKG